MKKDRIVEITGLAILLIQRLYGKDYNVLFTVCYSDFRPWNYRREYIWAGCMDNGWTGSWNCHSDISGDYFSDCNASNHGIFCFTDACQIVSILASKEEQNIVFLIKAEWS